jgi:tRNA A37 N6-isopentenylltransferase MiaA
MLSIEARIPSVKYRPMSSTVHFSVEGAPLDVKLTLPNWNTNALLTTKATQSVGQIGSVVVGGSFMYFSDVVPGNVDVLKIDANVSSSTTELRRCTQLHYRRAIYSSKHMVTLSIT